MKKIFLIMLFLLYILLAVDVFAINDQKINRDTFTLIQTQNSFVSKDHVVWYPEFPTSETKKTVVLYDTRSTFSKFKVEDQIVAKFISFDQSQVLDKPMQDGDDGVKFAIINKGERQTGGFIVFVSENNFDNWSGSPWKFPLAKRKANYVKFEARNLTYFYFAEDLESHNTIMQTTNFLDAKISELEILTSLNFINKPKYFYSNSLDLQSQFHLLSSNYAEARRSSVYVWESKTDLHELTHLLFNQVSDHAGIFAEGVAVYFGQNNFWRGKTCDSWTKYYLNMNILPSLSSIATFNQFQLNYDMNYPISCSLSKYLIDRFGLERFKILYKNLEGYQYSLDKFTQAIQGIYFLDLNTLEVEWKNSLEKA